MPPTDEKAPSESGKPRDYFATTEWTMVLTAGRNDETKAREALAHLCEAYWYPLYAYVRRRGESPEDAEDLTQGFFERLLELHSLAAVRREKGKFRSFLLASLNHYLSDQRDRARAQKRGGGRVVALDRDEAETRLASEAASEATPEKQFERKWATTLLQKVLKRLQSELEAEGKGELFMALRFSLTGEKEHSYASVSVKLGLSESAVRVAAHRLRRRYKELLRAEITRTVATAEDVDEEIRYLHQALAG